MLSKSKDFCTDQQDLFRRMTIKIKQFSFPIHSPVTQRAAPMSPDAEVDPDRVTLLWLAATWLLHS